MNSIFTIPCINGRVLISTILCEPTIYMCKQMVLLPGLVWGLSNPAVIVVAILMLVDTARVKRAFLPRKILFSSDDGLYPEIDIFLLIDVTCWSEHHSGAQIHLAAG